MRRCFPLLTAAVTCGAATLALLGLAGEAAGTRSLAMESAGAVITAVAAVACLAAVARRADARRFDALITAAREDRSALITTLAALAPARRAAERTGPMRRVR